jgi:hypothetical protein
MKIISKYHTEYPAFFRSSLGDINIE